MAKFDIGSFAASLNETVSKLDTNEEPQLRYVDIDQLDANEANFYAVDVSKLDTLADSIAMDGLQQPLVVTAGQDGRYTVISGHRRRAAIRKLVEEDGREDLRRVPCLVKAYQSQALAELQLIMANSTARVLTSLDTSQVSRPRWGRWALLALCALAVICVTPAQIAAGDWFGAAAIVALCTVAAVVVLGM